MSEMIRKLAVNGTELYVMETGAGDPALVFLHYWGGSSRTWTGVVEALGGRWRALAYDHRGWGDSAKAGEDFGLDVMTEDAAALIAALRLTRYVLVGNSMGGKVAQKLAARRPEGLEALVLVAPAPPTPIDLSPQEKAMRLASYDSAETVNGMLDALLTRSVAPEVRQRTIVETLKGAWAAKRAWVDVGMAEDIGDEVARITVPTLVITGTRDVVDPEPVLRREIGGRLPQARFVVLEGIGHFSAIEAPGEVAAAIMTFLGALDL
ncbi:alpha/beta fold hydrolase [Ensifer adhaerens]|uniref:alpha/beta fold hydrolase n=1 Tax=Ensifer adhaerens TaxID=106592 RepID=UPI003D04E419